ncbi:MAG TPA: MBOAT family protein [Lachnospiraceae bacterium]|nr:MBOAT family protein [Lachnospiraceae bacterium]
MVFSSLLFTFFFLPAVMLIYFLAKDKYRNYILLAASLIFYGYGEPKFVFIMLASIMINYGFALRIDRIRSSRNKVRFLLVFDVAVNLGILFVFKYLDFAISATNQVIGTSFQIKNIALPIGISFFTFQALSYVIDVYRGQVEVQKNPLLLALYISFFPQLIAGPIVRYKTIEQQITIRKCTLDKFAEGGRRFLLGFCKKVILSNNLSVVAVKVWAMAENITNVNPIVLWIGSICYSLQIFYDFSGYSDMAIGLGKIFGFEFEENFNYPYIAKSVTEFWRRWHISLGQWFRDYVYIPLGGSQVPILRHVLNLFVVWFLTGLWHGASWSFVAWGLGYFVLLFIEKFIVKPSKRNCVLKAFWQLLTLISVNFGWVIFNSVGISMGLKYCFGMLGHYSTNWVIDSDVIYFLREYGVYMLMGIAFAMPVAGMISARIEKFESLKKIKLIALPVGYGIVFLWAVSFLILGMHNPFIYFNF